MKTRKNVKKPVKRGKGDQAFKEHMNLLRMLDSVEGMSKVHKAELHPLIKKEEQLRESIRASSEYPFLADRVEASANVLYKDLYRQALKVAKWDEKKAEEIAKKYLINIVKSEYKGKKPPKNLLEKIKALKV